MSRTTNKTVFVTLIIFVFIKELPELSELSKVLTSIDESKLLIAMPGNLGQKINMCGLFGVIMADPKDFLFLLAIKI